MAKRPLNIVSNQTWMLFSCEVKDLRSRKCRVTNSRPLNGRAYTMHSGYIQLRAGNSAKVRPAGDRMLIRR